MSSCIDCPAGKYQDSLGHSGNDCKPCAAGKFQDQTGMSSCTTCAENKYSQYTSQGSTVCTWCEGHPGNRRRYSAAGSANCKKDCKINNNRNPDWNNDPAWGDWGSCSATCGGGQQYRYRTFEEPENGGQSCPTDGNPSSTEDRRNCNAGVCPTPSPTASPTPSPTDTPWFHVVNRRCGGPTLCFFELRVKNDFLLTLHFF